MLGRREGRIRGWLGWTRKSRGVTSEQKPELRMGTSESRGRELGRKRWQRAKFGQGGARRSVCLGRSGEGRAGWEERKQPVAASLGTCRPQREPRVLFCVQGETVGVVHGSKGI